MGVFQREPCCGFVTAISHITSVYVWNDSFSILHVLRFEFEIFGPFPKIYQSKREAGVATGCGLDGMGI